MYYPVKHRRPPAITLRQINDRNGTGSNLHSTSPSRACMPFLTSISHSPSPLGTRSHRRNQALLPSKSHDKRTQTASPARPWKPHRRRELPLTDENASGNRTASTEMRVPTSTIRKQCLPLSVSPHPEKSARTLSLSRSSGARDRGGGSGDG